MTPSEVARELLAEYLPGSIDDRLRKLLINDISEALTQAISQERAKTNRWKEKHFNDVMSAKKSGYEEGLIVEREACAKVADIACVYCGMDKSKCSVGGRNHVRAPLIATAIRKRGEVGDE